MQKELKLVLIGACNPEYPINCQNFIEKNKAVWSFWNFRIRDEWQSVLKERIATEGKFPLYLYMFGESGKIEYLAEVIDFETSHDNLDAPDAPLTMKEELDAIKGGTLTNTWLKYISIKRIEPRDLSEFYAANNNEPLVPTLLRSSFGYAHEVEVKAKTLKRVPKFIELPEPTIEEFLENNLNSLEAGLKLYSSKEQNGNQFQFDGIGRINFIAKDKDNNFVGIKIKTGTASNPVVGEILTYMGWIKQNLAKENEVRGIIVANDFDEKLKYAVSLVPGIILKKFIVKFEFQNIR
ncbi:MAG: hypothetical protein HY929_05920 [Euryarchaeota archaeon]|nr:hypothetical protein [Euryarchaeota archaeon]